jgi:two-component system CheB/CheR fusion protein
MSTAKQICPPPIVTGSVLEPLNADLLLDAICDGAAIVELAPDQTLALAIVSGRLCRALGLAAGRVAREQLATLFSEPQQRDLGAALLAIRAGHEKPLRMQLQTNEGLSWWVRIYARELSSALGGTRWLLSFIDITEHHFRGDAVSRMPIELITLDAECVVRWLNPLSNDLHGLAARDMMGRSWFELVPSELQRRDIYDAVLRGESHDVNDVLATGASGEARYFSYCLRPVRDRSAAVTGIMLMRRDATERHSLLAAHEVLRSRFSTLGDHINDVITVLSTDGRIQYRSGSSLRVSGFSPTEVLNHPIHELVMPQDHAAFESLFHTLLQRGSGAAGRLEMRLRQKSGDYRWFESSIVNAVNDPAVAGLICVCRDINDRRAVEEKLRRSEHQFSAAFEMAQDLIIVIDQAGDICNISPHSLRRCLGYQRDAVMGKRAYDFVHPDDAPVLQRFGDALTKMDDPQDGVPPVILRLRTCNGGWRAMEATAVSMIDEDQLQTVVVTARDMHERGAAEIALRQSEMRYRALVELFPGYVQELEFENGELEWRWVSDGFRNVYGVDLKEFKRRGGWRAFRHPHDADSTLRRIEQLKRGELTEAIGRIMSADGELRWIHVINSPLRDPVTQQITTVLGVAHDITVRTRALQLMHESHTVAQLGGWELNLQQQQLTWTDSTYALFETSREDFSLSMTNAFDWYLPAYRPAIDAAMATSIRDGQPLDIEVEARTARGRHIWLRLSGKVEYANDVALRMYGAKQNITARKAIEQSLRESESLLRAVTENAPDWLMMVDTKLRIQFINRPIWGQAPQDLIGRHALQLGLPDPQNIAEQKLRNAIDFAETVVYETKWVRAGGARYYETSAAPIIEHGRVIALSIRCTNITARRASEDALRTQASILETMREGVMLVDASGTIRLSNPAAERMFGHTSEDLRATPFTALLVDGIRGQLLMKSDRGRELLCRRADGSEFIAEVMQSRAVVSGEVMSVFVILDASDRHRLERELLDVTNREQQRIGSDLHDGLGQELTGIALLLRGLSRRISSKEPDTGATVDEISGLVSHAVESARSLAQGLSPIHLERGGLEAALRALVQRASTLYGIEVSLRRYGERIEIDNGRALHVYRIVQEAITNAVKHGRAHRVKVRVSVADAVLKLEITDDGRGMHSADAPASDGMGLRIMEYRAHMIGGSLIVEVAPLGGVKVTCLCPNADLLPHAEILAPLG